MKSDLPSYQRHNLQHRGHPAMPHAFRASSLGNVDAGDKVGIMLEATEYTPEPVAIPIGFVDHSAPRTGLAGEFRGYPDYWYPSFNGFIGNEVLELAECPGVMEIPLSFPGLCPVPDEGEVFKDNGFTQGSGFPDNEPTYVVQHPVSEPFLPSANGNKPSFSGAGASLLKFTAFVHKVSAPLLQRRATEYCASRKTGKVVKPAIHTDSTVDFLGYDFLPDDEVEVKAVPSMDDFTLTKVPAGKVPCLVMVSDYRDINPALNSNHREPVRVEPIAGAVEMEGIAFEFLSLLMPASLPDYFRDEPGTEWGLTSKVVLQLLISALKRQIKKPLIFIQSLKEDIIKIWGELKGYSFGYQHSLILT